MSNDSELRVEKPSVLDPKNARQFYEDGSRRFRRKRLGDPSNGFYGDSMHVRGVRAALEVSRTLPPARDAEAHPVLRDPAAVQQHYDLGLTAIRQAGVLPLDKRFEGGYSGWATLVIDETVMFSERAANPSSPQPDV